MLKHCVLGAGLACLLLLTSCTQGPSTGSITLVTHIDFSMEPYRGTFELTEGADVLGCKAGSFVDTPMGDSVLKELTCEVGERSGTFTLEFAPENAPNFPGLGTQYPQNTQHSSWSVKDSSDDFSGLSGGGDFLVIYDNGGDSGVETFTGEVQYAP